MNIVWVRCGVTWVSCLLLMSSSHPSDGLSLLSERCFKVGLRLAVLSIDQYGAGALFRREISIQESIPFSFATHEIVKRT